MYEQLKKKRSEEGGFTLIELLIVIIILGILAAIVVFAVGNTRKDSVASSCKTDFKSVELSAEAINTKAGAYPGGTYNETFDNSTTALANPLTTGNTPAVAVTNTASIANNGALLKTYPGNGKDYRLSYVGSTAVNTNAPTFAIHVQHLVSGSFADVGTSPLTTAGCDNL